jgi:hypothetical protein
LQYIHILGTVCGNPTTSRGVPIRALIRALRRRPLPDRLLGWLAGHFTTWPADEFARFTRSAPREREAVVSARPPEAPPLRSPEATSIAPGTFELRFAKLHQDQDFDVMWDMLAEDAQRSWGSRPEFVERMQRQASEYELLEAQVGGSEIVPEWTDRLRNRTYRNVARLDVLYRIRHGWRDVTMRRQVHLVPAAGGWRTLFYPAEASRAS